MTEFEDTPLTFDGSDPSVDTLGTPEHATGNTKNRRVVLALVHGFYPEQFYTRRYHILH